MTKKLDWENQNKISRTNKNGATPTCDELPMTSSASDQHRYKVPKSVKQEKFAQYKKSIQKNISNLKSPEQKQPILNEIIRSLAKWQEIDPSFKDPIAKLAKSLILKYTPRKSDFSSLKRLQGSQEKILESL